MHSLVRSAVSGFFTLVMCTLVPAPVLAAKLGVSPTPAMVFESNRTNAQFGTAIATAGDVNGDGYSDLIVGAPGFDQGLRDQGKAFLYYGSAKGLTNSGFWSVVGTGIGSRFGETVSPAGDVNRDGYADLFVNGALFLGSAHGPGTTADWSAPVGDFAFYAGDVNGDGFDDWVTRGNGIAVYHGTSTGGIPALLPSTVIPQTFFPGPTSSVDAAGDVNGDGFGDIVVGSGGSGPRRCYLFTGSAAGVGTVPFWTTSSTPAEEFGFAVGSGDTTGDGFADLLFLRAGLNPTSVLVATGAASSPFSFVWGLGAEDFPDTNLLWNFDSIAAAGDVNGDGFSDIIVSGNLGSTTSEGSTSAVAIYTPGRSVMLWSQEVDGTRVTVSSAGDVDGDGFGDFAIGFPLEGNPQEGEGVVRVFLGGPDAPTVRRESIVGELFEFDLASFVPDVNGDGFGEVATGEALYLGGVEDFPPAAPDVQFSNDFSDAFDAGDIDGDGFADLVRSLGSSIEIWAGGPNGLPPAPIAIESPAGGPMFGDSVSMLSDVDGDGFADALFSVNYPDTPAGSLYRGGPAGLGVTPAWTISDFGDGESAYGWRARDAGDVNGDGFRDLIAESALGAPPRDALLFLGSTAGPSTSPSWTKRNIVAVGPAGDVNGDGYGDILTSVGPTFNGTNGAALRRVQLFLGSAAGISNAGIMIAEGRVDEDFGATVGMAGDVNGDGWADMIIGSPSFGDPQNRTRGKADLYLGDASGDLGVLAASVQGGGQDGFFGYALTEPGDHRANGYSDFFLDGLSDRALVFGNRYAVPHAPLQTRTNSDDPIAVGGVSDASDGFRLSAIAQTAAGRGRTRLEYQITRLVEQVATVVKTGAGLYADSGLPDAVTGAARVGATVAGLAPSTFYGWRARVATGDPRFPHSIWLHASGRGPFETALRTAGDLPAAYFHPVAPAAGDSTAVDEPPRAFVWSRGSCTHFRMEWSRNDRFENPIVRVENVAATPGGTYETFVPDVAMWRNILELGVGPDLRPTPIFWRVVATSPGTLECGALEARALRLPAAQKPLITSPADGTAIPESEVPRFFWDPQGNEAFEMVFAKDASLRGTRRVWGEGYTITGTEATVTEPIWNLVVQLAAENGGRVVCVLFAKDRIGRIAWSQPEEIQVIPSAEGAPSPSRYRPSKSRGGVPRRTPSIGARPSEREVKSCPPGSAAFTLSCVGGANP